MKISTNSRYGLRALVDLAEHSAGEPVTLCAIAARQEVSESYMEQAFASLKKAGLLRSARGSSGGYMLAREAEAITVGEVLRVLEGDLSIVQTILPGDAVSQAVASLVWSAIDRRLAAMVNDTSLTDLIQEHERMRGSAHEDKFLFG